MSFTAKTAFLPRVWNNRNDDLQNVAGVFGSGSGSAFKAADCSAGMLCTRSGVTSGGIDRFVAAAAGDDIWFCNPSDVQRLSDGAENLYAVGPRTLGLGLPAGTIGTFTRAKEGEVYAFGIGNFESLPDSDYPYVVPGAGGLFTVAESKPASGMYFMTDPALDTDTWTEGNIGVFKRVNLVCCRA